ncbi:hypothetical protein ACIB24_05770 [Spongisporangium articulatum]|uniref:Uncharacterized protein n=1 Tax=Spongisporangium articulatum TaxID=3362603 RepID=A0ABW8ALQ9_9ACTN
MGSDDFPRWVIALCLIPGAAAFALVDWLLNLGILSTVLTGATIVVLVGLVVRWDRRQPKPEPRSRMRDDGPRMRRKLSARQLSRD